MPPNAKVREAGEAARHPVTGRQSADMRGGIRSVGQYPAYAILALNTLDEISAIFEMSADPPLFMPTAQMTALTTPPIKQMNIRFAFTLAPFHHGFYGVASPPQHPSTGSINRLPLTAGTRLNMHRESMWGKRPIIHLNVPADPA